MPEVNTIMPLVVDVPQEEEILKTAVDDIRMAAIDVLASAINHDGLVVASEYASYIDNATRILGQANMEDARFRVLLLNKLLTPPSLADAFSSFTAKLTKRHVAADLANDVLLAVIQTLATRPVLDDTVLDKIDGALRAIPGKPSPTLLEARSQFQEPGLSSETSTLGILAGFLTWGSRKSDDAPESKDAITTQFNKMVAAAQNYSYSIHQLAELMDDATLKARAEEFNKLVQVRDFRIALIGEMKRGKSSLFNALAGDIISPIAESMATTAAVVELAYADTPNYEGYWISSEDIAFVKERCKAYKDNVFVQEFVQGFDWLLNHPEFSPAGHIPNILSTDDLPRLLSASPGSLAPIVGKVSARLPLPVLQSGAVIVDTPGINDPIQVRDEVTFRCAQMCQCIVMVMSAQQLGTHSEGIFLRRLLESGITARLIIAITHADQVSDPGKLVEEVRRWLTSISRNLRQGEALHSTTRICLLDARKAAENVKTRMQQGKDFQEFRQALEDQINALETESELLSRIGDLRQRLQEEAERRLEFYRESFKSIIPDEASCLALQNQSTSFVRLMREFQAMVSERLAAVTKRLEFQQKTFTGDIRNTKEAIRNEVTLAYQNEVQKLGAEYSKRNWKDFAEINVQQIVDNQLRNVNRRYEEHFRLWEMELEGFSKELQQLFPESLERLKQARIELANICVGKRTYTALMCNADRFAMTLHKGAMVGGVITMAMVYTGIAIGLPHVAIFSVFAFTTARIWGVLTNPEQRKDQFINSHVEQTMTKIEDYLTGMEEKVTNDFNQVGERFLAIAKQRYEPLIMESMLAAIEARLNANVFNRVRQDTMRYLENLCDSARRLPAI